MVKINILIAGVGGQGIITLGKILANAALESGLRAIVAETHGLSQRGGAVNVHVRIGDNVISPLIPFGEADYILGLEAMEVLRNLIYASKSRTLILINRQVIRPVLPKVKVLSFEEIDKRLSEFKRIWFDAFEIAQKTNNPKGVNIAVLGFLVGLNAFRDLIPEHNFLNVIKGEENKRTFIHAVKFSRSYVHHHPLLQ